MDAELIQDDDVPTGEMSGDPTREACAVTVGATAQALYLKRLVDGAVGRDRRAREQRRSGPRAPILDNSTDEQ